MKILFVLEHYHPYIGGAEKLFRQLAESLSQKNNQITVVTTKFREDLENEEILNEVKVIRINCKNRFLFTLKSLPLLLNISKEFDIIHTTTYNAALPAWIAAKINRKKIFLTFHEYWNKLWFSLPFLSRWERYGYYFFEKLIFKLPFDKIIAVSDFTKNELIRYGKKADNVIRIYNGLDYKNKIKNKKEIKNFTCTYFGRLGVSKGLDILIPAIQKHLNFYPDSSFNLVIPTLPKKIYNNILGLLQKHGLSDKINLHHELERETLNDLIHNSSCVIIPSYSEGFCFTAAEAGILGTPIISSGKGALKETVSGYFIEIKELNIEYTTEALEKAYLNKWDFLEKKNFPLEKTISEYLGLYVNLIN